jgi:hypothetical protein
VGPEQTAIAGANGLEFRSISKLGNVNNLDEGDKDGLNTTAKKKKKNLLETLQPQTTDKVEIQL